MYAAGTGPLGSSGAVLRRLTGTSARRHPRSHAATAVMMRPIVIVICYRRASWMLSEIVCSGARQKLRTTSGGTTATKATMAQLAMDVMPMAIAATKTTIDHAMNTSVLVVSEDMRRV